MFKVFELALAKDSDYLADVAEEHLCALLNDDGVVVDEKLIYDVVVKWGQCHQNEGTPTLLEVLGGLWPCVRWSLMSQQTLRTILRSAVVPVEVLLPFLVDPEYIVHKPRQRSTTPRDAGDGILWLQRAYSSTHHQYIFNCRPSGTSCNSPVFQVQFTHSVKGAWHSVAGA